MDQKGQLIIGSFFDAASMYKAKKELKITETRDFVSQGYKPTGHNSDGVLLELTSQPIAYYNYPTLNRMVFRDKLWQGLLKDPNFSTRMIQAKALWGETGHKNSLEVLANQISNKVTNFWLSEDKNNLVLGTVQVLDTPEGNIIFSLLKSGDMGISSRGWGDLVPINSGSYPEFTSASFYSQPDMKVVDEAGYIATCWDFVTVPAVGPAMLSLRSHLENNPDVRDAVHSSLTHLFQKPEYRCLESIFSTAPRKIYVIGSGVKGETTRVKGGDTEGVQDEDSNSNGEYYKFDRGTFSPTKARKTTLEMGKNGFDPIPVDKMQGRRFKDVSFPHITEGTSTKKVPAKKVSAKKIVPILQGQDRDRSMQLKRPDENSQRKIFTTFLTHEVSRKLELLGQQQASDDNFEDDFQPDPNELALDNM